MKRVSMLLLLLLVCAAGPTASARQAAPPAEVSEKEWHDLLVAASGEDWASAFNLSTRYLKRLKETDARLPRLRYIYLYAAAGRVSVGDMGYDELERAVKEFKGKEVSVPYRQLATNCRGDLNFICATADAQDRLVTAASNKTGTTILAFEYVQLKDKFDAARHEGEEASLSGRIDDIQPNPNRSTIVILRIYIKEGSVKLKERPQNRAAVR